MYNGCTAQYNPVMLHFSYYNIISIHLSVQWSSVYECCTRIVGFLKTSQELRMLSSVTLNCQVTQIVMNSGSLLSKLSVSQISQVSRIALWRCSLNIFLFVIVFVSVFVIVIVSLFGLVMSPHHSDQMLQKSQVSGIALWRCSLNVFVIVFVFFFVFVFLLSLFLSDHVSSSPWSNVLKVTSLWDRSLKVLSKCICLCHCLCHCICHCLFLVRLCLLIVLIKSLKGHNSLRSLFEGAL